MPEKMPRWWARHLTLGIALVVATLCLDQRLLAKAIAFPNARDLLLDAKDGLLHGDFAAQNNEKRFAVFAFLEEDLVSG